MKKHRVRVVLAEESFVNNLLELKGHSRFTQCLASRSFTEKWRGVVEALERGWLLSGDVAWPNSS